MGRDVSVGSRSNPAADAQAPARGCKAVPFSRLRPGRRRAPLQSYGQSDAPVLHEEIRRRVRRPQLAAMEPNAPLPRSDRPDPPGTRHHRARWDGLDATAGLGGTDGHPRIRSRSRIVAALWCRGCRPNSLYGSPRVPEQRTVQPDISTSVVQRAWTGDKPNL